jgi:hypothetical protein
MGCGASSTQPPVTNEANPSPQPKGKADAVSGGGGAAQELGVIIEGGSGLPQSDNRPYCIVRVGTAGSTWQEKGRGAGRESVIATSAEAPSWNLGLLVEVAKGKELCVRVLHTTWLGEDEFVGEAVVALPATPPRKGSDRIEAKLMKDGTLIGGVTVLVGAASLVLGGSVEAVSPSKFEAFGPIGAVESVLVQDITAEGPLLIGRAPLPLPMQGLFWLTKQGASSALASMGGPSNDGGGVSSGKFANSSLPYTVRVSGDRTWAFSTSQGALKGAELIDLCYNFHFDETAHPTKCQIIPES